MLSHAAGTFDPLLVQMSVIVAVAGAFVALELAAHAVSAPRKAAHRWLSAAAVAFGASVWTMHFLGMLAYRAPVSVTYDIGLTILSLVSVLALSWVGFALAARRAAGLWTIPTAGSVTAGGITAMHYIGMAVMQMPGTLSYKPGLVAVSVLCAFLASTLALHLAFRRLSGRQRLLGAVVLGFGVVSLHYIGMAAAEIDVGSGAEASLVGGASRALLSVATALGTLAILAWMMIGPTFDRLRTTWSTADQEARYRAIVDTAVDPIVVIDDHGTIVSFNNAAEHAFAYAASEVLGQNVNVLMPEPDRSAHDGYLKHYRRTGERRIIGIGRKTEARRKDGSTFPIDLSVAEWWASDGRYFTGILRDVTEQHEGEREQRRLREALESKQALLRTVVDRLPSGLVVAEAPSGRVIRRNAAADRLLGQCAEAIGSFAEYDRFGAQGPDGAPLPLEDHPLVRAAADGVEVDQQEMVFPGKDGSQVILSVNAAPVYDADGRVVLAVSTFNDVTERRSLEAALRESESQYRSLVEQQTDLVVRLDADRTLTLVNDAVCKTLGRSRDDLIGSRWDDLLDAGPGSNEREALDAALAKPGARVALETSLDTTAGPRWFLWEGSVFRDLEGNPGDVQLVGRDVTERRAAVEAAEEANLAKSKFLAIASHDLRQPLQSLFFVANTLRRHVSTHGRANLDLLETGLKSLKDLLDSLLDVSRIDAGAVEPEIEDVELAPLLLEIADTSRPLAEQKGLALEAEVVEGVLVRTDRTLLERILRNLTENAIRYTERGHVHLSATRDEDTIRIDVADTGAGIPRQHLSRIFEEFHQIGNEGRDRAQGLGLGLAIVRRLSRLLNHPVKVVSTVGKGSTFSVHVPVSQAAAHPKAAEATTGRPQTQSRTILAIDDDGLVLMGIEAMLQDWGHAVLCAHSADDALGLLEKTAQRPELVICDYRLAKNRFGTEAVRLVRERVGSFVPAIILTGETSPAAHRAIQDAAAGVAHKPITPWQLQEAIEREIKTRLQGSETRGAA